MSADIGLRFQFAQGLVREAGQAAADLFRRRDELQIERKGKQDFVSEADKACEAFLVAGACTLRGRGPGSAGSR